MVLDARPERCRRCGGPLDGDDPEPIARQVLEIPHARPHVTEHRVHRLACPRCGASTCGPMLHLLGLPIGPAAVCDLGRRTALAPAHVEALKHARTLPANVRRDWLARGPP